MMAGARASHDDLSAPPARHRCIHVSVVRAAALAWWMEAHEYESIDADAGAA